MAEKSILIESGRTVSVLARGGLRKRHNQANDKHRGQLIYIDHMIQQNIAVGHICIPYSLLVSVRKELEKYGFVVTKTHTDKTLLPEVKISWVD